MVPVKSPNKVLVNLTSKSHADRSLFYPGSQPRTIQIILEGFTSQASDKKYSTSCTKNKKKVSGFDQGDFFLTLFQQRRYRFDIELSWEMELETSSAQKLHSLDPSRSPTAGSIHSIIQNPRHSISKSIIDTDITPTLTIAREQETNGSASTNVPSTPLLKRQIIIARIQFITLSWTLFLAGWNDGSTGPLLPRIQEVYHVSSAEMSSWKTDYSFNSYRSASWLYPLFSYSLVWCVFCSHSINPKKKY